MRKHAEVVRLLRTNPSEHSTQSGRSPSSSVAIQRQLGFTPATTLATQLEGASRSSALLSDSRAVGMKEGDLPVYRNLLQLLASMTGPSSLLSRPHSSLSTGESEGQSRPPGYFSPVALDHSSLSTSSLSERRKLLSSGSRGFLEKQFENLLVAKVDNNRSGLSGRDERCVLLFPPSRLLTAPHSSNSMVLAGRNRLERVRMFTSLKTKARQIPALCCRCVDNPMAYGLAPPQRGAPRPAGDFFGGVPVWPQIYFCLRTGDLKDAHAILKTCLDEGINGVDEAAFVALGELIKLNQRGGSEGGSSSYRPHQISTILSALSKCNALYREALNGAPPSGGLGDPAVGHEFDQPDPYRLQVLSLLGLADLDALCDGTYLSDTTVEDFLWTSLWFVHWTQILSSAFTETTAAGGSELDLPVAGPSFAHSKSYTPGFKSGPPTPASFSSFNSPSRVASTGDRMRNRFDLIDPLTQTPSTAARDKDSRQMTPSGIRRMHTEHLPKVYR
jgi:hypothetical protein